MNYIKWKGKDSRLIDGLLVCQLPPITKPKMRISQTYIDGVDGCIVDELGYDAYEKELEIGLTAGHSIDDVIDYFTGAGDLVLSNEEDKVYSARIVSQVDYERLLRFRKANVKFLVQPYKHKAGEQFKPLSSGGAVMNAGNCSSLPVLHLKGSGSVEFKLNDSKVFDYTFDSDGEVWIDSEKEDAYFGGKLKNRNMNGDFITLARGKNVISYDGDISLCEIKCNTRFK